MKNRMVYVAAACALAVALQARAQIPGEDKGTVTGHGTVDLKRQPNILRLQVDVLAKGKDLKEALAKLKTRRESVEAQLAKFGAAKEAVVFAEPVLTPEKTDRQRQMEMMVRERLSRGGKKPDPKAKQPPAVVVSAALKVEIPLKAATTEELLLAANDLQEKIKAADLAGLKEMKALSPQEEELAEEAGDPSGMMGMGPDGEPQRGEPVFLFVSKISDDEYAKALADAFQKAKKEAARLAKAAGTEIDALQNLTNTSQGSGDGSDPEMYSYNRAAYYAMQRMRGIATSSDDALEAIGIQPTKTSFRVMVSASFQLKKPAPK